jgi:hypothetical protein
MRIAPMAERNEEGDDISFRIFSGVVLVWRIAVNGRALQDGFMCDF